MTARAQSNVVGVAVLLAVTMLAFGAVTASVGTVVESSAATADASRVAADLDDALRAVEATGPRRGHVSFTGGELSVVQREVRVLDAGGVVETVPTGALVFSAGDQRVVYLAGAVVRDTPGGGHLHASPPVTASRRGDGVLVVGAPSLEASPTTVGASGPTTVTLRTNVSHDRRALGEGTYRVAVETTTPGPWRRYFERQGATVTGTRDFDGDGTRSVVARFPGRRTGYLVVHALDLEVSAGG